MAETYASVIGIFEENPLAKVYQNVALGCVDGCKVGAVPML